METIKATNETVKDIVKSEIERLGNEADLNHIDVSGVTDMNRMFFDSEFNGDISMWNISDKCNSDAIFLDCHIPKDHKPNFKDEEGI